MAKAKKTELMAKLQKAMKPADAKRESAPEFKVNPKHVHAIVAPLVAHITSQHAGLRDLLMKLKGEHPLTLDAALAEFKRNIGDWLKKQGRKLQSQSVYNMVSDVTAAIRAYQRYAGASKTQQQHFDANEKKASGYVAYIAFCRKALKSKSEGGSGNKRVLSPAEARINSAWKNRRREALTQAKDWIRFAPTDSILALIDFAQELVTARKKGNIIRLDGYMKAQAEQEKKAKKAA